MKKEFLRQLIRHNFVELYFLGSIYSFYPKTAFCVNLGSLLYFSLSLTFLKIFVNLRQSCFEHIVRTAEEGKLGPAPNLLGTPNLRISLGVCKALRASFRGFLNALEYCTAVFSFFV